MYIYKGSTRSLGNTSVLPYKLKTIMEVSRDISFRWTKENSIMKENDESIELLIK